MRNEHKHAGSAGHSWPQQDTWEARVLRALTIIIIGGVLLLNTTGAVGWGIWWNLVRLWPLWLIVIGINIVLGWSRWSRFAGRCISLLMFAFILYMSVAVENPTLLKKYGLTPPDWAAGIVSFKSGGGQMMSETITVGKDDFGPVTERTLTWDFDFGVFTLKDGAADHYLQLKASYPKNIGEPHLDKSVIGGLLDIKFATKGVPTPLPGLGGNSPRYDFTVGMSGVRTDLNLSLRAGKGTIDLKNLNVDRLSAEVDAGELEAALAGKSLPQGGIRVKVRAGKIKLALPAATGYRLDYMVGIGSIKVPGKTFSGLGGGEKSFMSANYGTAAKTVSITAEVGVGSFEIVTK
jgi:hypothetical protein